MNESTFEIQAVVTRKISCFVGCNTVYCGRYLPGFRMKLLPLASCYLIFLPLRMLQIDCTNGQVDSMCNTSTFIRKVRGLFVCICVLNYCHRVATQLQLTLRLLMSYIYIYGAPILGVSRSHTTTHHSR